MTRTAPEVSTAGPKAPAGRRARILQRLHGPPVGAYDAHGTRGGHRGSKGPGRTGLKAGAEAKVALHAAECVSGCAVRVLRLVLERRVGGCGGGR